MPFEGQFTPPGDKSMSHRLILMSLISKGEMLIDGLSDCEDVKTSLAIFRSLGGKAEPEGEALRVHGMEGKWAPPAGIELACDNSGTTIRLLMGILAGRPGRYVLDGDVQLRRRPMERVAEPLRLMGAEIETVQGKPPVTIVGKDLTGIDYRMSTASAQLKSAILLAGLAARGNTTVTEPHATRDHTERLIDYFGGKIDVEGLTMTVAPKTLSLSSRFSTPGDPSSSAFFLAAAAMVPGSRVTARNLLLSRGRSGFLRVLDRMGAKVSLTMVGDKPEPTGDVTVSYDGPLKATEILAAEIPSLIDEVPILALAATQAQGLTVFRQVDELRVKETDRLMAIRHQLGALGARVNSSGDDLAIEGPTSFILPDSLDSGSDHRLAMTLSIALKAAGAAGATATQVPILGRESIAISYPSFDDHLAALWKG
ncbi:MAG: 3-phosphoshikimate 1-carboxyvinyltransferase [Deltaproteobacteria bacterium]|jgi:3-phosphoshikimate 1-carboxyvinyltransferase|nr:3-phosphoshikimate 1-carboxyvinyltransferase [Deltaproteobacteria bacterium]